MMKRLMMAAAFTALFATPSLAAMAAQEFVNKAASGGMFEVRSSEAALPAAQNGEVKTFAQKMIDEHTAANKKLMDIAAEQKLTVPAEMDPKHQDMVEQVVKAAGGKVDPVYMDGQIKGHEETVQLLETYIKEGDNQALVGWATETLPAVKMHYEMGKPLAQQVM